MVERCNAATFQLFFQAVVHDPAAHLPPSRSKEEETRRAEGTRGGFDMRAGLCWGWEVVTGLCGDPRPVEPANVMVMR